MNFFIAIELILAKKSTSSLSKTISGRLAAILCKGEKKKFFDQQKRVSRLYDMRSKFVHSGEDLSYEACKELKTICQKILMCLLRSQKSKENHGTEFPKKWQSKLDLIGCGFRADENLSAKIFEDCGIVLT